MAASKRLTLVALGLLASSALAACSEDPSTEPDPSESSVPATTSAAPTTSTESAASATVSDSTSPQRSTQTSTSKDENDALKEAQETFSSVLPEDIWDEFDSCAATGLEDSFECSGPEVGQFQLFDSQSKAASTTQLLTELRSSRVVTDTGRFVIGWSTLGTTAVVTIVDNEEGLVAQQLVSSDQIEPEDRIEELGLDQPAGLD